MKRFIVGFIPLSFMVGLPTIAGRMACVLAAALLACASSAHSQVIEESGFPVKGGGVSGESFSLSCPPRLYVEAGGSVLFSCSATAVPEEGVRYEWKSLSGDGLHLLSDANERSPLFTAPVSEAGAEYVYRLTAMSVGVYETATVTVMAHDVSGGSLQDGSKSPESPEACDSFGALEGFREGCVAGDKMPPSFEPFGGGPEGEGGPGLLFPEAPVLPDRPSGPVRGGGSGRQAPPRLECPVAVFLEELETGQIECHAWDASGEEFLEYSWEPVGSTTRDYLNNPRLIPEDAPNPSVVAPEAPVYETLESFHSGETTFRYRYRLTATSRATGLSSSSEVGVYVSSSRPSVYCPLEIVVEEGSTAALDCEGVDPLSHRMDYDEDGASIEWEWEGLWGTSTAHLDETDLSSPLFTAPVGSAGEEYHYIASMTSSASGAPRTARRRVTVRVTEAEEGEQAAVKVTAQNVTEGASGMPGQVECFVIANNVYEGDPDRRFRCRIVVTGDDQLLSVTWTWEDPYDPGMLSATNIRNPIFYVPESVSATTRFDFQVTAKYQLVSGYKIETLNIYAIVNNLEVVVACDDPGNVEEGDADITFSCSATYPLSGTLRWSWSPTTRLTGHNTGTPRFDVPDDVDGDKTYTYAVRVTADRADPGGETVKVKVRNADTTAPAVRCTNASIYEGSRDITLSCSVTNEPAGATYGWAGADIANRLTGTDGLAPTFAAPDDINEPGGANKDYEYTVTLTAGGVDVATEDVTVTVLEKPDITWCGVKQYTSSYTIVWEGYSVETNAWYCAESPQGAPGHNPAYMFWWSTLGDTPATAINLLQPRDVRDPIFSIPPHGTVDEDQTYEFRATISAANADDATWDWRVIVKNSKVTVTCDDPAPVDEGDMDFDFACFAIGPPGLPDYTWSWSPTDGLTDHNTATPTFDVPDNVDQDTTYTYTVTVMEDDGDDGTATVTVTVRDTDSTDPSLTCTDSEVYEGSSDITLDCSVTNEPSGATYAWTARSRRAGTSLLSSTSILKPTFDVPDNVDADTDYEYTVTMSASGLDDVSEDIIVTVKNRPPITVDCDGVYGLTYQGNFELYEGDPDKVLNCRATGAPVGSVYAWSWSPIDRLTDHHTATPTFAVPDAVDRYTVYTYTVTATAANAEDGVADVIVRVYDTDSTDPSLTCTDSEVYEGSSDITLDCSVTNEPSGATYAWTARSRRAGTSLLSSTSILKPTFDVPDNVDADTDYEYTVTMSASGLDDVSEDIIVTVKNRPPITVDCDGVYGLTYQGNFELYEGDPDKVLNCRATGAPVGSVYAWSWSPIDRLTDHHTATPTFAVPDAVDRYTVYTYTVTATAANAEDGVADVIVRVYDTDSTDPSLTCTDSEVYEGSSDITLDCSVTNEPSGATYAWTGTDIANRLSGTTILKPTFDVPPNVDADTDYEYTVTVSADNAEDATADVTVTVLNKKALNVACATPSPVYEGSADLALDCVATGAPAGSAYEYAWTAQGDTENILQLSATDIPSPTFYVPDEVDATTTYEYLLTVSAENAEDATAAVTVTVLNRGALSVVCADTPSIYEGSEDFALDCSASGAPAGSTYEYVWTARGSTANTDELSAVDISSPTFYVPDEVDETTTYEYLLTASAENAESGSAEVTVTVLNAGALHVVCASPASVYEGSEDITLDCTASGAPAGSAYEYAWTAQGDTENILQLSATDIPSPTFYVPDEVDETTTYEYLLTASAENAESGSAAVTVMVLNAGALRVVCASPASVYEGSADFALDCSASGAPSGSAYEYAWTARGSTQNTLQLSATDIPSPTFYVPDAVDVTTDYEYLLTVSADNAEDASAEVMVTVLNKGALAVVCTDPGSVYEGSEDIAFDCEASGAPGDRPQYAYAWTARGDTQDMSLLSAVDMASPTFYVPDEVSEDETYEYLLTVSADNAEDASAEVMVTVLNKGALAVVCTDPGSVYEGSEDIAFDCEASGAPGDRPQYAYAWTARGDTQDMSLLSAVDMASPTFYVPDEVSEDETYEYLLTVSADNAEDASAEVMVTVLNKGALAVVCTDPGSVYEGSEDIAFDCEASGAPGDRPQYAYAWTARGDTQDMSLLSAVDMASPTFSVPDAVDVTTDYEYLLTVSAANAEDASAEVTVTVLNKEALALACADPGSVYEGSEDIAFDCAASGAPEGSDYAYAWTARGDTQDMSLLSAVDMASPTFYVPDEVSEDETYEYLLTVSADNAEDASAEVMVTVLNKGALAVVCTDPGSVYEGSEDIAFDCEASGAPGDRPQYAYAWTARGDTQDMSLLSAVDMASPTFYVPDEVSEDETYEYLLTVSADNAEDASAEVMVTVLNKGALAVVCTDPGSVYEGSEDIAFDCAASGAPEGSDYEYAWAARGGTADMSLLSAADNPSPTFYVPDEVSEDETYEYLLTVSAANAEDAAAEVTVTVLNKEALALSCADPGSVYEGSEDFSFDCTASGALGDDPVYTYAWTARGDTQDTSLLSATDIASPTFHVPAEVDEDETYEYLLTVSAANAEDASVEVTVTVLDRVQTPPSDPVSRPLASSSAPESAQPSSLGVTVSASSLRFGVQSAGTQVSLDPMTDQISTRVSGPYHAGRMTLSPGGSEALDENGEMDLSIELASPVVLRREGGIEAASIVLAPQWSLAESCEQLSSQAIGGLYTEVTLSEADCRLLLFGGELDLTDVLSGQYTGSLDIILRSGESEETHSVDVEVTVVPAQRVITIGPGGVRFSTSRELPVGLTEEQNLSIYPHIAFLTEEQPHGVFELSNPSLIPLEISVSARFGYTEATENGREVVVEDISGSHLGDLSQVVGIHPGILVLQPGEKGLVRYGMQEGALAAMTEKGYAAFFDVMSEPRQYVRTDQMPEEVSGDRTARVTMRVPGVYVPGEGASQLRAALLSISFVGPMSATFLLETQDHPFAGEVVAYDGEGRELGRRETLVYTRSRVRIPLDRMPEEGAVFLRFSPRGSGRVPEPASVEWDAPRRDIGEAQKKEKTPTTATVAGRP